MAHVEMYETPIQPSDYPIHHQPIEAGSGRPLAFQASEYSDISPENTTGLVVSSRSALDAVPDFSYSTGSTGAERFSEAFDAKPEASESHEPRLEPLPDEVPASTEDNPGPAEALRLIETGWVDKLVQYQAYVKGYPLNRTDDIAAVAGWRMYQHAERGGTVAASGVKLMAGRLMIDDWHKTIIHEDPQANLQLNVPEAVPEHTASLIPPMADSTDAVEKSLIARAVLDSLPERGRKIVEHRMIDDMSVRETAAALGVSENTVKSALSQAMVKMLAKLGDMGINSYADL